MTTYSISLDDVDLAFLPLRTHKYNDFLKNELFQFQVMKTETVEETVPTIFYTCHICDIEVPTAFASEHAASIKHKANTRIANVAMQRTRKLISLFPLPFTTKSFARFCANCATLADENHDNTNEHRSAVKHDNKLWELMKLYVSDNDESNNENILNDNSKSDKDKAIAGDRKTDEYKIDDSNNKDINAIAKAIPINSIVKNKKRIKTKNKEIKDESTTTNSEIIKKYEEVTKVESRKNITIHNQTDITKSTNKHILDTYDTQDGSLINDENYIRNMKAPNGPKNEETNETETNKHSAKHENNNVDFQSKYDSLFPPLLSKRSIRTPNSLIDEITNIKKSNEPSCVTNKIETRQLRANGDNKLSTMLASLTNDSFKLKESKTGIHIKIHDEILNIDSASFHSYVRFYGNDKEIKCLVCDCILTDEDSEAHKYDLNHMRIIANIGYGNDYVRKINDIYSHCILCNMKIRNTVVAVHKNFCYHIVNKNKNIKITTGTDKMIQKADITVERASNEIQRGIPVIQNKNIHDKIVEDESNGIVDSEIEYPYVDFSGELRCVVCNCRVPRNLQNRIDHINGSRHIKNMKKA